ncbi:hypothetical protein HJC23_000482 [Cyclotella cryptica]|uniref:Uncharacterized protein n=1 Tax=Cyclotella cryptica TaxID=29204 RepID=A0ABD3QB83_9STRA
MLPRILYASDGAHKQTKWAPTCTNCRRSVFSQIAVFLARALYCTAPLSSNVVASRVRGTSAEKPAKASATLPNAKLAANVKLA